MDHPEGIACPIPPKRLFICLLTRGALAIALSWGGAGQKKIGKDKRESLNFQIKPGQKLKLSFYTVPKQNVKSCNAKERVKTTRVKWRTTTIGPISKKQQQLCTCSTLFCTFLCCCFAWLQHETSRNFLVKCFINKILCVFLFTYFSLLLVFNHVAASISDFLMACCKILMVFFKRNWSSPFFKLSRCFPC